MNVYKFTYTYIDKPYLLLNIRNKHGKRMRSGFSTL